MNHVYISICLSKIIGERNRERERGDAPLNHRRIPSQVGLQRLFEARAIHKRYAAIVAGYVAEDEGLIDSEIDGRQAVTRFEVRDSFTPAPLQRAHTRL